MSRRCTVMFRGEEIDVVVDARRDDPETNSLEIEWHFDGVSPEQHDALGLTDEEEQSIFDQIEARSSGDDE